MERVVTSATGEQATWTNIENMYIKSMDQAASKSVHNATTNWLWMNYDSWGLTAGQKPISLTGVLAVRGLGGFGGQIKNVSLGVSDSTVGLVAQPSYLVPPFPMEYSQSFTVSNYDHTTIDTVQIGYRFFASTFPVTFLLYYQLAYLVYEDPDEPTPFCIIRAKMLTWNK